MATKKYVDLAGLTEFKSKLLNAYSKNNLDTFKGFAVAKATAADSATKATQDASGHTITSTYTPMERTIAEVDLQDNITKAEMLTALNVADGAQVNVVENVGWKQSGASTITWLTPATVGEGESAKQKAVYLDLSAYALKSELVHVLKFMGVKDYEKDLPTASADTVGHIWHVKYRGTSGADPLNAEFVGVDMGSSADPRYKWEQMGSIVDLSNYYTKAEVDGLFTAEVTARNAAIATAIAELGAEITSTDGTKVAVKVTEVDGKITAVNVTETDIASAALLGTTSDTKTDATAFGYIAKEASDRADAITSAIQALGATPSQAAGADGLALSLTEVDGKVTAISGSIAANTYDAYGSASSALTDAKGYTDTAIAGLKYTSTGAAGSYIQKVSEADGVIAETVVAFDTAVSSSSADTNAPTSKAVYTYAKGLYDDIDSVTIAEIDGLFPTES